MVLPLPPFCDAMTIVFMKESLSIKEQLHESITSAPEPQVPDEWRTTNANCSLQRRPLLWLLVHRSGQAAVALCYVAMRLKTFFHENIYFNKYMI